MTWPPRRVVHGALAVGLCGVLVGGAIALRARRGAEAARPAQPITGVARARVAAGTTLQQQGPALTGKTRVVARSQEYGFPPLVAYHTLPARDFLDLQQALVAMADDAQGREVLKKMNLDGFALPQPEIYRPVREIIRFMEGK